MVFALDFGDHATALVLPNRFKPGSSIVKVSKLQGGKLKQVDLIHVWKIINKF